MLGLFWVAMFAPRHPISYMAKSDLASKNEMLNLTSESMFYPVGFNVLHHGITQATLSKNKRRIMMNYGKSTIVVEFP